MNPNFGLNMKEHNLKLTELITVTKNTHNMANTKCKWLEILFIFFILVESKCLVVTNHDKHFRKMVHNYIQIFSVTKITIYSQIEKQMKMLLRLFRLLCMLSLAYSQILEHNHWIIMNGVYFLIEVYLLLYDFLINTCNTILDVTRKNYEHCSFTKMLFCI